MAKIWILFLMVVQFLNESYTAADKSVCGNLSLQYVFFLVPSSAELPQFEKFLSKIHSARFLKASGEDEVLKVGCDPEDWDEIYRYTIDRKIYFSHTAYCVKKNEHSTHQELRLGRNKLDKMKMNPFLRNLIDRERLEGQKIVGKKNWLEESTTDKLSGVLNNGRIRETRSVYRKVKQSGARNKPETTKSSVFKNSPKTTLKDVYTKNKSKSKEEISSRRNLGGRKSLSERRLRGKLSPKKSGNKTVKKINHRSVKTESRGSSPIGKTLLRVKKNALNYLGQNNGDEKNIYTVRGESGVTPSGKRESSLKPSDVVKLATLSTTPASVKLNNTKSRNSKSGKSNGSKNGVKASRSRTVKAKNVTDIPRSATPSESSSVTAGEIGDENWDRQACSKSALPRAIGSNVMLKRNQKDFNRPDDNIGSTSAACVTETVLRGSPTTGKNDLAFESRRDSAHSIDCDLDDIAVGKKSIGELADHIRKILEWVNDRGEIAVHKKG